MKGLLIALTLIASAQAQASLVNHGACMLTQAPTCVSYEGSGYAGHTEALKKSCLEGGGEFYAAGCPRENSLGTCHLEEGQDSYYSITAYADVTREDAESSCVLMEGRYEP